MSDKFSAYDILFVGKPMIKELSGNRVLLSGKCRWCFGNGRVYNDGEYEQCKTCMSINGYINIITNRD